MKIHIEENTDIVSALQDVIKFLKETLPEYSKTGEHTNIYLDLRNPQMPLKKKEKWKHYYDFFIYANETMVDIIRYRAQEALPKFIESVKNYHLHLEQICLPKAKAELEGAKNGFLRATEKKLESIDSWKNKIKNYEENIKLIETQIYNYEKIEKAIDEKNIEYCYRTQFKSNNSFPYRVYIRGVIPAGKMFEETTYIYNHGYSRKDLSEDAWYEVYVDKSGNAHNETRIMKLYFEKDGKV